MRSMFDLGFRKAFMPLPMSGTMPGAMSGTARKLGQDDGWEPEWEPDGGFYGSYDQGPPAEDIPDLYTSYDQGPPAEPVAGLYTQKDLNEWLKAPSPETDWSKVAQALIKGTGDSYAAYQKAQNTFDSARAKAGLSPMPLQTAADSSSPISPNVIFLVGGLAVAVLAAVALS